MRVGQLIMLLQECNPSHTVVLAASNPAEVVSVQSGKDVGTTFFGQPGDFTFTSVEKPAKGIVYLLGNEK